MFKDLDGHRIESITKLLRPQLAVPGETIFRKGEAGHSMYFISSGAIVVQI